MQKIGLIMSGPLCMRNTVLHVALKLLILSGTYGYNLDTKFPIIYSGSDGSYFGYTTALHRNRWGPVAVIGAPRANTTTFKDPVYEPGTLFRCNITKKNGGETCQEVLLMKEGAKESRRDPTCAYTDNKHSMWLGVSLDVRPRFRKRDIVVCGHLWKNQYHRGEYFVNGVCFVINEDFEENSILKLLPLTQKDLDYGKDSDGKNLYNYAHGQAGMSATYSQSGSRLLLGAPGVWTWTGTVVDYPGNSDNITTFYGNRNIPSPAKEIEFNSYFGYSVTTGSFFNNWLELIATGAPKDGGYYGKVYIIRQSQRKMIIHQRINGFQLGEYFGASILGINVNGDSYTDLLVGAPLNSIKSSGDEGKVYVYLSNGMELQKATELVGDKKINARFGTSLANIGDLNQDGLPDIAVGAPYEDNRGAVYIYHGSELGIKSQYAQKVVASEINRKLSGFGIHISRGMDIDDNGYPDILVGSYASANAVLLRSRPFIHVFSELSFSPRRINVNQTLCEIHGRNLTCVRIDACVLYRGKHVHPKLAMELVLEISDRSHTVRLDESSMEGRLTSRTEVDLDENYKLCSPFDMHLRPDIKDLFTPITVRFSHKLIPPAGSDKVFHETYPMYHPTSNNVITADITFQTGCGKVDECRSDLIVSATRTEPVGDRVITLGNFSRVAITITVKNMGEPAYVSELHIYLPPELQSINQDFCEVGNLQNNASLVCDLGNPLRNDTEVEIHITVDATKIPPHTKYLEILCRAVTFSTEINEDDNTAVVPLHLKSVSDIGITGVSSHEQIMYNGSQDATPVLTHTYVIRNYGPSPLETIEILLPVPFLFLTSDGNETFVTLTGLKVDSKSQLVIPTVCERSPVSITKVLPVPEKIVIKADEGATGVRGNTTVSTESNYDVEPPSDLTDKFDVRTNIHKGKKMNNKNDESAAKPRGYVMIDCSDKKIECVVLRCSASPFFNPRKFAQLSIDFQLDFTVINKNLGSWYEIEFLTTAWISIPDTSVIQIHQHPNSAQVRTVILHEGPPPPKELSSWIILVSAGVGVISLMLILLLLIQFGFFERKDKNKMEEMLYDAQKEENIPLEENESDIIAQ